MIQLAYFTTGSVSGCTNTTSEQRWKVWKKSDQICRDSRCVCAWKQILYLSAALYEPILCPTLLQNLLLPLGVRGRIARSPKRLCVSLSDIYHHFIQSSFFPPRPLLFTRSLTPVFATTLLTPDIVKTAHIPIQHNCTLLEGGARFFATDSVRLQAEIANVD